MNRKPYTAILAAAIACCPALPAGELDAEYGAWKFTMNTNRLMTVEQNGTTLLSGVYMTAFDPDDNNLESKAYTTVSKQEADVTDAFGSRRRITWTYTMDGKPTL